MVSPSNTSPQFTKIDKKGFYARTAPSDLLQGDVLASLLVEDGVQTVSIFLEQTLTVEVLLKLLQQLLKQLVEQ